MKVETQLTSLDKKHQQLSSMMLSDKVDTTIEICACQIICYLASEMSPLSFFVFSRCLLSSESTLPAQIWLLFERLP